MRNPAKAIVAALLIAIPAPFVLGFLLVSFTPELFQILSQSETSATANSAPFVLGSAQGIAAYVIAVVIFAIAGFITVAVNAREQATTPAKAAQARAPAAPRRTHVPAQKSGNMHHDDDDDFDDSTPEGDEDGTVKWFNVKKGFGFIVRDSGDEIFVHFRAIRGSGRRVLRQGQLVRFSVVDADKGLQADNVSILSE
jgi:CspA family cold shock protein